MKKAVLFLVVSLMMFSVIATAATVRNNLNQRVVISLNSGRSVDIAARGTVQISDSDVSSPHLQTLVQRGDVSVSQTPNVHKKGQTLKLKK